MATKRWPRAPRGEIGLDFLFGPHHMDGGPPLGCFKPSPFLGSLSAVTMAREYIHVQSAENEARDLFLS